LSSTASSTLSTSADRLVIAWRRGEVVNQMDAIMAVVSNDRGNTFTKAAIAANLCPFDLNTAGLQARTKSVSVLAADYPGRFYLAFASRDSSNCLTGPSQVMLTTSTDGVAWAAPVAVDPIDLNKTPMAHQFMPAIAVGGKTVQLAWVDFRNDAYRV